MSLPTFFSLALTGYPLGHSMSPAIHAAALRETGLQGEYKLYPIAPGAEGPGSLADLVTRVRSRRLHGLNVTIPHKETVIPLVDELTPMAHAIGAVNTIFWDGEKLIGDNTDAPGFLADLERLAPDLFRTAGPGQKSAVVLGSGGGARAVAYALAIAGWQLTIVFARPEDERQANCLADDIARSATRPDVAAPARLAAGSPDLLVNCTPLGMHPHPEATPWPQGIPLPAGAVVYDIVYNPVQTRFVAEARAAGLPASTGLGMLVSQAALAFERWTGKKPPFAPMLRAAEEGMRAA
ncbi:MAG: shikimate dehydrogenase [Chloroflexota bacterium]